MAIGNNERQQDILNWRFFCSEKALFYWEKYFSLKTLIGEQIIKLYYFINLKFYIWDFVLYEIADIMMFNVHTIFFLTIQLF